MPCSATRRCALSLFALLALLTSSRMSAAEADRFFGIQVVDSGTGRGVPLVELETVHNVKFVTDSAGWVAIDEPGWTGLEVFFHVRSHGYEFPADGFGLRGRRLKVEPGGRARLEITRLNMAERLYRVTGADLYRDSLQLGLPAPIARPLRNAQVVGQDSVLCAAYRGRLYWFWGDTNRLLYPLGNFHVPGATSPLPGPEGLDQSAGINLTYFEHTDGFARETSRMPGTGPTWLDGLTVLKDPDGRERMFAHYVKVKPPLTVYEDGIVEFNDAEQRFEQRLKFPQDTPLMPSGHTFLATDGDREFAYFAKPFALTRVRATPDAFVDASQYETWTYFRASGATGSAKPADTAPELDRAADGTLQTGWKRGAPGLDRKLEKSLRDSGRLRPDECFFTLSDADSGRAVIPHNGTIQWNAYRQRWVMVFVEHFGTSLLGEVWYAEAAALTGPWRRARKVVTHNNYSFYNPRHHAPLDQAGGRLIYFEGTYTNSFTTNPVQTPRYEYNQMMYRLDLADPRLTKGLE